MAAKSSQTMTIPTDAELIQAQADLWRHNLSYLTPMALRCAVQLGIPTVIHRLGGAASLPDLVTTLSLPPSKATFLGRLLRLLAATGVLASNEAGIYSLVPLSYLLVDGVRIDGDASQTALVLAVTSRHYMEAAMGLADWFKKDIAQPVPSPFEEVHGATLFEESMAVLDPECDKLFNEALAAHDHMGIGTILRECHGLFNGVQSLTDCCGGDGTTARAIVKAFPHIKHNKLREKGALSCVPRRTRWLGRKCLFCRREKNPGPFPSASLLPPPPPSQFPPLLVRGAPQAPPHRFRTHAALCARRPDGGGGSGGPQG